MTVKTGCISVSSKGNRDIIDLTEKVKKNIDEHNCENGIAVVYAPGSTAAITTIEFEPGLVHDIPDFLERIIPYNGKYHHHETWHDDNGSSHIQAALIGPSLSIPVVNGELTLGTWQQIVLIDCDTRARTRKIVVQMVF